jgi:hypothetical protein
VAPKLNAGSHTFTIEITNYNSGSLDVDCVSFRDDRFSVFEDNSVDTTFFTLSGPEEFPAGEQIKLGPSSVSFHLTDATVSVSESAGETINQIAVSGDGGSSFTTSTGSNSASLAVNENTRSVITRLELGGFDDNQSKSPTDRDAGHKVDLYELAVSGNDLTIIENLELTRNHFENLKKLHEFGDYVFVIKHQSGSVTQQEIESFQRGDQSRPKVAGFDDPQNQTAEVSARRYYNSIFLQGSEDNNGNRPSVEVSDSQAVNDDGRKISPGVLRDPTITTEAGAAFRARSLLSAASDNNILVGNVTVPPTATDPGFVRPIDFGNGEVEKTVERVTLTESSDTAEARFEFSTVEDLASEISELRQNARDIGDQV